MGRRLFQPVARIPVLFPFPLPPLPSRSNTPRNIYTVPQLNTIPTAGQGAAVVNSLLSGVISDLIRNRPLIIVYNMILCLFGNASLAVWKAPTPLKFLGYILITTGLPAQSLTITWLNEVCQGNATLRGLIVSIGNTCVYTINSFALGKPLSYLLPLPFLFFSSKTERNREEWKMVRGSDC